MKKRERGGGRERAERGGREGLAIGSDLGNEKTVSVKSIKGLITSLEERKKTVKRDEKKRRPVISHGKVLDKK